MIEIQTRMRNGEMEIYARGHAGHGEPGEDIVCAAVSAIMQTAVLGLDEIAKQYPGHVKIETHSK